MHHAERCRNDTAGYDTDENGDIRQKPFCVARDTYDDAKHDHQRESIDVRYGRIRIPLAPFEPGRHRR